MVKKNDALTPLGLAKRAGKLVAGIEESRRAIRQGIARVVVIAADASEVQKVKVRKVAQARDVPVARVAERTTLGHAIGQGPVTAVVVTDPGLAATVVARLSGSHA